MGIREGLRGREMGIAVLWAFGGAMLMMLEGPAHGQATSVSELREPVTHAMHWIAMVLEICGVATIALGAIGSTAVFFSSRRGGGWDEPIREYRANLGRGILLGLEFLIAADIIGTVAVTPTFQNLGVLAAIIGIRTFLSFSLQIEIEGHWPWKRRERQASPAGEQLSP